MFLTEERTINYFSRMQTVLNCYSIEMGNSDLTRAEFIKKKPFPYSTGQLSALKAWADSPLKNYGVLACERVPSSDVEVRDFIKTLSEAGASGFAITDQGTHLVQSLYLMSLYDCKVVSVSAFPTDFMIGMDEQPEMIFAVIVEMPEHLITNHDGGDV